MNEKKVMISYKYYFFLLEKKLTNAVFPRGACTTVGTVTRRRDESKKDTKKVDKERQRKTKSEEKEIEFSKISKLRSIHSCFTSRTVRKVYGHDERRNKLVYFPLQN